MKKCVVFAVTQTRPSVSSRIIALFFAVVLPILFFGGMTIHTSINKLHSNTVALVEQGMQFTKKMLEKEIASIQFNLRQLLSNANINADLISFYGYYDHYSRREYYLTVRRISTTLQNFCIQNSMVKSLEVYYVTHEKSISSKAGLRSVSASDYDIILNQAIPEVLNYDQEKNDFFLILLFPGHAPQIMMIAHLDIAELTAMLSVEPCSDQPTMMDYGNGMVLLSNQRQCNLANVQRKAYEVVSVHSDILNSDLNKYLIANEVFTEERKQLLTLMLFLVLCVPLIILCFRSLRKTIVFPVKKLVKAMEAMQKGDMTQRITSKPVAREFNQLFDGLNFTMQQIERLINSNYKYEIYTSKLELKHLQAQIHPHFLFNTLYLLRHMIAYEDTEHAMILSQHLGDYFKYLSSTGEMEVPLNDEYEHAKNYLAIQAMRFGAKLVQEQAPIPEKWSRIIVPRLIIQPIYENAISYAMHDQERLLIRTTFETEGEQLVIRIEDNGTSLDDEKLWEMQKSTTERTTDNITALYNIRRRLVLFYDQSAGMTLSRSVLGGLCVELRLSNRGEITNE